MAYNRELSQFSSLLQIDDSSKVVGLSTNINVSGIVSATFYYGSGQYLTGLIAQAIPAGSSGQIQYNNGVSLGATTSLFINQTNFNLGIGTSTPTSKLTVFNGDIYLNSGVITATTFYGNLVGTATRSTNSILVASNTDNYTHYIGFCSAATGNEPIRTDTDLSYNPSTGVLSSISFSGAVSASTVSASSTVSFTGTTSNITASSQTTGSITLGGPSQTGTQTFGLSTSTHTTNFASGVSGVGTTKTVNIGTGGDFGSFTLINIGPSSGVGTVSVNSSTNLAIGAASSTGTANQRLRVEGGAYFNGSVGIGSTNPSSTLTVSGGISGSSLNVSGVSTFAGVTTSTSSLFANQLSVSGVSTFAGVTTVTGTTLFANQLSVSGVITASSVTATTFTGTATTATSASNAYNILGSPDLNVSVVTSTGSTVNGDLTSQTIRIQSVAEKSSRVDGNTATLTYSTGSGNIAICTNPSGSVTLNVTGIPTSNFDNQKIEFSVIVTNSGVARSCTAVTLNGVSRTIRWKGGSIGIAQSVGITTFNGYDIYNFVGFNTIGSGVTASNYEVFGSVNGGFR